jgi:DNA-binding SARP family transcriptional activator
MTPAQHAYDKDLARALANASQRIERRSGKIAALLKTASQRIDALSSAVPVDPAPQTAQHQSIQPASPAGSSGHA